MKGGDWRKDVVGRNGVKVGLKPYLLENTNHDLKVVATEKRDTEKRETEKRSMIQFE